jgi:hypothetical protein
MSQPHAQRMIDASKVAQNLIPIGITPKNEAQARELVRLTPDQQRVVAKTIDFKKATAKDVAVKTISSSRCSAYNPNMNRQGRLTRHA